MYVYFPKLQKVLTCEEFPQCISIHTMKENELEDMCNKWEKIENVENGTFTLSYKYRKPFCDCINSDLYKYECYNCSSYTQTLYEDGTDLYLQNSGNMGIVECGPNKCRSELCKVIGYDNMYKWNKYFDDGAIYALQVTFDGLTDVNIVNKIDTVKDNCCMLFVEEIQ